MSTIRVNQLRSIMNDAWRTFRVTGESFATCLKRAWMIYRLAKQMKNKVVQFFYLKCTTGEIRQAFGTMQDSVIADKVKGTDNRRKNSDLFTYYDLEKDSYRSFKKFNLIKIA